MGQSGRLSERKAMYAKHGSRLDAEDTKLVCADMSLMVWSLGQDRTVKKSLGVQAFRACELLARLLWPNASIDD